MDTRHRDGNKYKDPKDGKDDHWETPRDVSGSDSRQVPVRPPLQTHHLRDSSRSAIDPQLHIRPGRISLPCRGVQQQSHGATGFRR